MSDSAPDTDMPVESTITAESAIPPSGPGFWRREWPYVLMLVLAVIGIAITNLSPLPTAGHWQILNLAFCVICIVTEWPRLSDRSLRWRLIWTQVLHWGTLLLAMQLLLHSRAADSLSTNALGLEILALLALGTLLAGIHAASWQIGVVGLVLALAVPAIAWLEQAALLLTLGGLALLAAGIGYVWYRNR
jgi:hypothetical protein